MTRGILLDIEGMTTRSHLSMTSCSLCPPTRLVSVEPATIRTAESKIAGCDRCRNEESDIPFNFVIADVLEKRGAFDFILSVSLANSSNHAAIGV